MAVVVVGSGGDRGGVGGDSYGGRHVELEVWRLEVVEVTMVMWGVRHLIHIDDEERLTDRHLILPQYETDREASRSRKLQLLLTA
ncbi:hypothetical protein Tco_0185412 [Tanacetum coccineum]